MNPNSHHLLTAALNPVGDVNTEIDQASHLDSRSSFLNASSYSESICSDSTELTIPSYFESTYKCPDYTTPSEEIPHYTPTLEYFGFSLIKTELLTPYKLSSKPAWEPVLLELNSTQLIIHKLDIKSGFKKLLIDLFRYVNRDAKPVKNIEKYHELIEENRLLFEPIESRIMFGLLLKRYNCTNPHKYTLNNCLLGYAANFKDHTDEDELTLVKEKNCIRLRVELHQLLLQFWSFHSMINWYRNLVIGKDLSDFNLLSKMRSLPNFELYTQMKEDVDVTSQKDEVNIDGYTFFMKNKYSNKETQLTLSSLPKLNSYDSWKSAIVSNFEVFKFANIDNNLYINYSKLNKEIRNWNSGDGNCRMFNIEHEGLVGLNERQSPTLA